MPAFVYRLLRRLFDFYSNRFLPQWLVLVFDVVVIFFSFYVAFAIRLNFELKQLDLARETPQALLVTLIYGISIIWYRSYSGIIRHTGLNDAYRVFQATATAFAAVLVLGFLIRLPGGFDPAWTISYAAYLIHFLLAYFILIGTRIMVKAMFAQVIRSGQSKGHRVIIFGAGNSGMLARNALVNDPGTIYHIIAYVDDNPGKTRKMLEGVPVLDPDQVFTNAFIKKSDADLLIISVQHLHPQRRAKIIEQALDLNLDIKVVPPLEKWIHGQLSSTQLQKVRIEDLMERERIVLDSARIAADIKDKVVLVTGAAGSIGSEISRQVLTFMPSGLILLDQAESAIFDLQQEISNNASLKNIGPGIEYLVANVKDKHRMEQIFKKFQPDIIYHAAAYKHVPLMESFPYEALLTNVAGTKVLADLALNYGVGKFVMVSTDKAVNPTNVMGASKRIAEIYTQCLGNENTRFITTRFGNVLDSSGSVVPLFRKQIERGGPVTITHKEITRFFMMISEACNLVLEAGAMGNGGEIFLFDMGEPVRILDLAKKMIRLSGLEPDNDIIIKEIGLRPGEKLFEEVLNKEESTLPTYHPKIMLAKVRPNERDLVIRQIDELMALIPDADEFSLVARMKGIVPEYRSENSVFSRLDGNNVKNSST